jgi:hypothetical protein
MTGSDVFSLRFKDWELFCSRTHWLLMADRDRATSFYLKLSNVPNLLSCFAADPFGSGCHQSPQRSAYKSLFCSEPLLQLGTQSVTPLLRFLLDPLPLPFGEPAHGCARLVDPVR